MTPRVRRSLWVGLLVCVAMGSGVAIGQTAPLPVTPVAPADPWASVLSALSQSPMAVVLAYGVRVLDNWRSTFERVTRDTIERGVKCLDDWRDDLRDHRLGVVVSHKDAA